MRFDKAGASSEFITYRKVSGPNIQISVMIAEDIRERIQKHEWETGEALPSEPTLAEEYGVSRGTVRSALQRLASRGLVIVRHGLGTFVTHHNALVTSNLSVLSSITETIQSAGLDLSVQHATRIERESTDDENVLFGFKESVAVVETHREVQADGAMIVVSGEVFPKKIFPKDINFASIANSIFRFFDNNDVRIAYANTEIHAVIGEHFGLFKEGMKEPFIGLYQMHYDVRNRPVMYAKTYFREETFRFSLMRVREENKKWPLKRLN